MEDCPHLHEVIDEREGSVVCGDCALVLDGLAMRPARHAPPPLSPLYRHGLQPRSSRAWASLMWMREEVLDVLARVCHGDPPVHLVDLVVARVEEFLRAKGGQEEDEAAPASLHAPLHRGSARAVLPLVMHQVLEEYGYAVSARELAYHADSSPRQLLRAEQRLGSGRPYQPPSTHSARVLDALALPQDVERLVRARLHLADEDFRPPEIMIAAMLVAFARRCRSALQEKADDAPLAVVQQLKAFTVAHLARRLQVSVGAVRRALAQMSSALRESVAFAAADWVDTHVGGPNAASPHHPRI